ncbi:hypothetical protein T492DRAFT_304581 [Pavlovales sp. CCMP2436]|nr:hypothetical protein T492DRAFT_304581 [Pavlovales sp. CCMP2436]
MITSRGWSESRFKSTTIRKTAILVLHLSGLERKPSPARRARSIDTPARGTFICYQQIIMIIIVINKFFFFLLFLLFLLLLHGPARQRHAHLLVLLATNYSDKLIIINNLLAIVVVAVVMVVVVGGGVGVVLYDTPPEARSAQTIHRIGVIINQLFF